MKKAETKLLDTHQKAVYISNMARKSDEDIVEMTIDVKRGTSKEFEKLLEEYEISPEKFLQRSIDHFKSMENIQRKLKKRGIGLNIEGKVTIER